MSNITVRKANVILTVPEEQKEEYLNKGFDVVNPRTFAVIDKAIPKDVNALSVMVQELQDKIKALTEENAKLKAQLSAEPEPEPQKEPEDSGSDEDFEEEDSEPVEEFTPINKRKSNKSTKK